MLLHVRVLRAPPPVTAKPTWIDESACVTNVIVTLEDP